MNMNDLKDQLTERAKDVYAKISANESVIQLVERYRNLSPLVQKALAFGLLFAVLFLIYSIPASFVDASKEVEATFQTNRDLIRGLYRSARQPNIDPARFTGQSFDQMKSQVEGFMTNAQIGDGQKGSFTPENKPVAGNKIPSGITQTGMSFELKKLNLTQVVRMSEQLSSMHLNTKLAAVQITADKEDPHYFNVKYTLSSLSLPIKGSPAAEGKQK